MSHLQQNLLDLGAAFFPFKEVANRPTENNIQHLSIFFQLFKVQIKCRHLFNELYTHQLFARSIHAWSA